MAHQPAAHQSLSPIAGHACLPSASPRRKSIREKNKKPKSRALRLEALEHRELFTVSVGWDVANKVLAYRGDDAANVLTVETANGMVSFKEGNVVRDSRRLTGISRIDVGGKRGNDSITVVIGDAKTPNMQVYGNEDQDTIRINMLVDFPKQNVPAIDAAFGRIDIIGGAGFDFVDLYGKSPRAFTVREVESLSSSTVIKARTELQDPAKHPEMQSPYKSYVGLPLLSDQSSRNANSYAAVIDQIDVAGLNRYASTSTYTFCNLLVGDVMAAMNARLPTKKADASMWAPTNELAPWLANGNGGWREVSSTGTELLNHVRAGKPALAIHAGVGTVAGHVVVIRPDQPTTLTNLTKDNLKNLAIAQAGAKRFNSGSMSSVDGWKAINFQDIKFYIHD